MGVGLEDGQNILGEYFPSDRDKHVAEEEKRKHTGERLSICAVA